MNGNQVRISGICCVLLCAAAHGESRVEYSLQYELSSANTVKVALTLPEPVRAPATLVMPRTYPGGYQQLPYDAYVIGVSALTKEGVSAEIVKEPDGPRWQLGRAGQTVKSVEYRVDVGRMESETSQAVSTSKVRQRYAGLLGYSVFAYVDGLASLPLRLRVSAPSGWPVLVTLDPTLQLPKNGTLVLAADYDALADAQVLMGPDLHVYTLSGAPPLFMAVYAEASIDDALEGQLARDALNCVQRYFGDTPIKHYTVQLELLKPRAGHNYLFSQEHTQSGSFSFSLDAALTLNSSAQDRERVRFNFAHHMAHSWVPARVYGAGYRPIVWEMTPVVDTIWFNEGFGRYAGLMALTDEMAASDSIAYRARYIQSRREILDAAPEFVRHMPLAVLSREASFLYNLDFRTGANVAARGLLMASEMDDRIREQSHGEKSLKDAFRWLLQWSSEHRTAFESASFPAYVEAATGVSVRDIFERWQAPLQ